MSNQHKWIKDSRDDPVMKKINNLLLMTIANTSGSGITPIYGISGTTGSFIIASIAQDVILFAYYRLRN